MNKYNKLLEITKSTMALWKESWGIAPYSVSERLDKAMLDWNMELTEALSIWIDKGFTMSTGELILARVNLGNIVEFWLKFFYSVYYEDYLNDPQLCKKGIVEPESMSLEKLKNYSQEILWEDSTSKGYLWVDSVQKKRNAIHSFLFRDIGTVAEFFADIDSLYEFVKDIVDRLPPLEDLISDAKCNNSFN